MVAVRAADRALALSDETSRVVPFSSFRIEFRCMPARRASSVCVRPRLIRTVRNCDCDPADASSGFDRRVRDLSAAEDELVAIAATSLGAITGDRNTSVLPPVAHCLLQSRCASP